MSLPKPHCAYCGKKLAGSKMAQIHVQYGVPGKPTIGWHWLLCHSADPLASACTHGPREPTISFGQMLREIRKRGKNRVSAGKAFSKWLKSQP